MSTEVFEGIPGGDDDPAVVTLTLSESAGRTQSGMEAGMQDAMDLLEGVAVSLI